MYKALMIAAGILNTMPRLIDFGTGVFMAGQKYSKWGTWCYYTGQAASFVLILWATKYPKCQWLFEIVIWFAISNLLDEMFFDPTIIGLNECIFAILTPLYVIYEHRRKRSI